MLNVPQGYASPPRIAAAALDDLFDHPAGLLNISSNSRITFSGTASWFFNGLLENHSLASLCSCQILGIPRRKSLRFRSRWSCAVMWAIV